MLYTVSRILTKPKKITLKANARRNNVIRQKFHLIHQPPSSQFNTRSSFSFSPLFQCLISIRWRSFAFSHLQKTSQSEETDVKLGAEEENKFVSSKEKTSVQLYEEAQRCEKAEDFVRARALYTEIVQRAEKTQITCEALNRLGILAQQSGDFDNSLMFFQQVLQLDPHYGEAYNNMANIYVLRGDIESAINSYRKAITYLPTDANVYLNLASLFLRTEGRLHEAIDLLRQSVSVLPTNSQLHSTLAGALQEDQQLDAAITHHKLALQYASKPSVLLLMKVAMSLIERRDYDAARVYVNQALALPVENNEPHKAMAILLKCEGKVAEAIEYLHRAIEIDPSDSSSYYQLAVVHYELNDSNKAVKFLIRAVKHNPQFVDAYVLLGALLQEHGKLEEAEKCLRRAIELNPNEWAAHLNLAHLLDTKNMSDAANHHRQIAIQINPQLVSIISPRPS
jgi:tetratricopeptide (TPR) repeat protein